MSLRASGRFYPLAFAFLGLAFTSSCSRDDAPATRPASAPVPVQIATAARSSLPIDINAIGTVQPLRFVAVKSQVEGILEKIHFAEGDEVLAGDALVTLDQRPFWNAVAAARAELANAQAEADRAATEAERYATLNQAAVISKELFQQLQTKAATTRALAQAREAALANALLQLDHTQIRAPISGRTGQRTLHEGALVRANDAASSLVVINQLSPIAIAFSIPDRDLPALRAALALAPLKVTALARDQAAPPTFGTVSFVDNNIDPATGTVLLKAVFENTNHALWPGQFAEVILHLGDQPDTVLIPTSAIQTGQNGSQVFVVRPDKTVDLRTVKTGRTVNNRTAILAGIAPGETVVTDGQLRLTRTSTVTPRTLEETPAAALRPPAAKDKAAAPAANSSK